MGSSDFARATRLETTITVTIASSSVLQQRDWSPLVPSFRPIHGASQK
jgi:hypothetical protein